MLPNCFGCGEESPREQTPIGIKNHPVFHKIPVLPRAIRGGFTEVLRQDHVALGGPPPLLLLILSRLEFPITLFLHLLPLLKAEVLVLGCSRFTLAAVHPTVSALVAVGWEGPQENLACYFVLKNVFQGGTLGNILHQYGESMITVDKARERAPERSHAFF